MKKTERYTKEEPIEKNVHDKDKLHYTLGGLLKASFQKKNEGLSCRKKDYHDSIHLTRNDDLNRKLSSERIRASLYVKPKQVSGHQTRDNS